MVKRKGISKKIRFEIFKRDSFTCQYCGKKSPDVILNIDHIKPVAGGGKNDILNLITSCSACNIGKGKRKISDKSVINKKREQLEELQERDNQIKMMIDWQESLSRSVHVSSQYVVDRINATIKPYEIKKVGNKKIENLVRKYGMNEVIECLYLAAERHLCVVNKKNVEKLLLKLNSYCRTRAATKKDPVLKDVLYIRAIVRNRVGCDDEYQARDLINTALRSGHDSEKLKNIARKVDDWDEWCEIMTEITDA